MIFTRLVILGYSTIQFVQLGLPGVVNEHHQFLEKACMVNEVMVRVKESKGSGTGKRQDKNFGTVGRCGL